MAKSYSEPSKISPKNPPNSWDYFTKREQSTGTSIQSSIDTPASLKEKYKFLDEIGHGSQGRIFKAQRLSDNTTVVIKQLNISSIKNWKEYELFHREADILQTLNIEGVAHFFEAIDCLEDTPPCSYIIQEYIPGVSLQKMVTDGHRFKMDDVYNIIIQTLVILQKLHNHHPPVIHRDIKPSNLMISTDNNGQFKVTIIDFGAVANPQVQGGGSTVAGTYGYMPPEQLMGKPVPASDIYSIGALAVQLFSGKSPADLPTKDFHLIFEPEMQDKPHELVTTIRQMLEPNVEQRLSNIPEIISRFKKFKTNIFNLSADEKNKPSNYSQDYENRLRSIRDFLQPGSIDLWQALPDSNRIMPVIYSDFKDTAEEDITFKTSELPKSLKVILYLIATISIIFILGVLISFFEDLGFLVFAIPVLIIIITYFDNRRKKKHLYALNEHNIYAIGEDQDYDSSKSFTQLIQLFQHSRKTMATILAIDYLPIDDSVIELNEEYQKTYYLPPNCYAAIHARPRFRIHYKFNPPDDKRTSDIHHSFVTHTEPENHYKIGDPIPILYNIDDRYFEDIVTSMPYPVPYEDFNGTLLDSSSSLSIIPADAANTIKNIYSSLKSAHSDGTTSDLLQQLIFHDNLIDQVTEPIISSYLSNQGTFRISMKLLIEMAYHPNIHLESALHRITDYLSPANYSKITPDNLCTIFELLNDAKEYSPQMSLTDIPGSPLNYHEIYDALVAMYNHYNNNLEAVTKILFSTMISSFDKAPYAFFERYMKDVPQKDLTSFMTSRFSDKDMNFPPGLCEWILIHPQFESPDLEHICNRSYKSLSILKKSINGRKQLSEILQHCLKIRPIPNQFANIQCLNTFEHIFTNNTINFPSTLYPTSLFEAFKDFFTDPNIPDRNRLVRHCLMNASQKFIDIMKTLLSYEEMEQLNLILGYNRFKTSKGNGLSFQGQYTTENPYTFQNIDYAFTHSIKEIKTVSNDEEQPPDLVFDMNS